MTRKTRIYKAISVIEMRGPARWKVLQHTSVNNGTEERSYEHPNIRLMEKVKLLENELKKTREKEKQILAENGLVTNDLRNTPYPGVENYTQYAVARLGLLPLANAEQLKPEFGPVINDVLSFRYPITVPPCLDVFINRSIFIAVISAPNHFNRRNMIRQSWPIHLKSPPYNNLLGMTRFVFVLGLTENSSAQSQIDEESKIHKDIIQMDMLDSYRNLTLKLSGLFNWVNRNCAKVNFIFKVDDDVYVNVHNLAHFLQSQHNSYRSVFGHVWHVAHPNRVIFEIIDQLENGKWTYKEWPWIQYPEYINGPAYLLHGSAILPLLAAFQTTPMIPFEDIYITGLCTEKAGIKKRITSGPFRFFSIREILPTACELRIYIAWLTDNHAESHVAVDDFYNNVTHCTTDSNGIKRTFDYTEPIQFVFN
uniref:Hexosyltransferase n=1 Tax=Daphnia galeata TaxID=27404 RepID=A0A8J2S4B5_9CRUS|nr:unnamed protein product [Daphnia galeata]